MLKFFLEGGHIPLLLLLAGAFFLVYLRFQPFRRPKKMLDAMRQGGGDGVSPYRAVTLALAGTLGVGNIVGVANAVCIGGAGAIFWMWISALFAMILKYAETVLAVAHRRERRQGGYFGGACYYIKDHFFAKRRYRMGLFFSVLFAALMILNALSMGCIIQVNAISSAFEGILKLPNWVSGLLLTVCLLPFLLRDTKGIAAFTEWLVPMMSVGYTVLSVAVLIMRRDALGEALASIFRQAFSAESMTGGVIGFLTSRAIRIGTMRGLLSNEAGCGTAPIAHATADTDSPAAQGVFGLVEVFVDTVLMCTLTALAILVSDVGFGGGYVAFGDNSMQCVQAAFSSVLGEWASGFLAVAVLLFGVATVLCQSHYGMTCVRYLSDSRPARVTYTAVFCGVIVVGAMVATGSVFALGDIALALMTYINLAVLIMMGKEVGCETDTLLK